MKIRNGFVANSSSSSFVIALDKPKDKMTLEEFKTLLFGDKEFVAHPYAYSYPGMNFSALEVARKIFSSLRKDRLAVEDYQGFLEFIKNHKHWYTCNFDDYEAMLAAIESGEYFKNIDHIRFSEH
jgi:hypothetical protein